MNAIGPNNKNYKVRCDESDDAMRELAFAEANLEI